MTRTRRRIPLTIAAVAYALLLALSHLTTRSATPTPSPYPTTKVSAYSAKGELPNHPPITIAYDHRKATNASQRARSASEGNNDRFSHGAPSVSDPADRPPPAPRPPGSPGSIDNFDLVAPLLNAAGYDTLTLDLPGFGHSDPWIPDYSIRAHARYTLALLDHLGIDRVHALGWSMGGGVALHMIELEPERVASLTMLGSIGAEETEGSGSFYFEKLKYAAGYAALAALPEAIPHFGLLGPRELRHAFIRNFLDTDQRPLRAIMASLDTPTLILHGRHDFLVADWAAERHQEIIPTSRLCMTPYSHFFPFLQPRETVAILTPFFERHDTPGIAPQTYAADLDPVPQHTGPLAILDAIARSARDWPWWAVVPIAALCARHRPETTSAILGWLIASLSLDFAVAYLAVLIARRLTPKSAWSRPGRLRAVGRVFTDLLWTAAALAIAQAIFSTPLADAANGFGWLAYLVLSIIALRITRALPTRTGRIRLRTNISKWLHHEWWPSYIMYVPLLPQIIRLSIRYKSPLIWTAANPGVGPAEGLRGESKSGMLRGLGDDPRVLPHVVIDPHENPGFRADRARACMRRAHDSDTRAHDLGSFPIIVKPDAGERGRDVTLVRTDDELDQAFHRIPAPAMLQEYHPGPVETGIFWIRRLDTVGCEDSAAAPQGFIFAITRKTLPEVTGDGKATLRTLVERHPRYRKQLPTHALRFGTRFDNWVPSAGERVRLTETGNHIKGCLFEDGADLITPELEAAVDELSRNFRGPNGEPHDFGRFDVRATSESALKSGDFSVIELNGMTSEATNLYDPKRSTRWAYGVLYRQWEHAFALGAARAKLGSRVLGWRELARVVVSVLRG